MKEFMYWLIGYFAVAFCVAMIIVPLTLAIAISPYWLLLWIATLPISYFIYEEYVR